MVHRVRDAREWNLKRKMKKGTCIKFTSCNHTFVVQELAQFVLIAPGKLDESWMQMMAKRRIKKQKEVKRLHVITLHTVIG